MGATARRAAVATLVVGGIVVLALALWKIKIVIALVFLGFIIAAAMRPSIEWLQRRARLPRGAGVLVHYLALAGVVALVLWIFVPRAIDQVQQATSGVDDPPAGDALDRDQARHPHRSRQAAAAGCRAATRSCTPRSR